MSAKIKVLGALGRIDKLQDVTRMLYYLTGMATERSAVLAYNLLHDGVRELDETAVVRHHHRADPPPGARPLRLLQDVGPGSVGAARAVAALVRTPTADQLSFAPVGVNNDEQRADFGDLMLTLGITDDLENFAETIARVERELLWARDSACGFRPTSWPRSARRRCRRGRGRPPARLAQPSSTRRAMKARSAAVRCRAPRSAA